MLEAITKNVLDHMRTQKAIADWDFTAHLLAKYGVDQVPQVLEELVGNGLDASEAMHYQYLANEIVKENQ